MLNAWNAGDLDAREHLASIIYDELHRLAGLRMFTEQPGHILNTSALVNEAFIRFMESSDRKWQDRIHFFAFMSRVMRQVLVDLARYHKAAKRCDGGQQATWPQPRTSRPTRTSIPSWIWI